MIRGALAALTIEQQRQAQPIKYLKKLLFSQRASKRPWKPLILKLAHKAFAAYEEALEVLRDAPPTVYTRHNRDDETTQTIWLFWSLTY